jgi:hypothetical protein
MNGLVIAFLKCADTESLSGYRPQTLQVFGLSNGYWLRAQVADDTEIAEEKLADEEDNIKPWKQVTG